MPLIKLSTYNISIYNVLLLLWNTWLLPTLPFWQKIEDDQQMIVSRLGIIRCIRGPSESPILFYLLRFYERIIYIYISVSAKLFIYCSPPFQLILWRFSKLICKVSSTIRLRLTNHLGVFYNLTFRICVSCVSQVIRILYYFVAIAAIIPIVDRTRTFSTSLRAFNIPPQKVCSMHHV